MKRYLLILSIVLFINNTVTCQYKIDKLSYDYHTYSYQLGDRYIPTLSGIASVIPGLGQLVSGEPGRGAAFFGGFVGSYALVAYISLSTTDWGSGGISVVGIIGMGGVLAIYIWNIADAVRVAKVNNLAFRDKNRISSDLKIKPYINTSSFTSNRSISAGLSLQLKF